MLRPSRLIHISFYVFFAFAAGLSQSQANVEITLSQLPLQEIGQSQPWLKLLQYQQTSSARFEGDVVSTRFYISPIGAHDPVAELKADLKAFLTNTKNPISKRPWGCAFPARLAFLQKSLPKIQLPSPKCPELEEWLNKIHADRVNIVYASQFVGNPASLLGHTFLRFYSTEVEKENANFSMLSYAVGFLAYPNPADSKISYMVKGIFGGYSGFYSMEPYYIKMGLYNNSESRDLYEQELAFSKSEIQFMLKNLWELLFQSEFRYYFFTENCSYRIVTLLEAARPDVQVIKSSSAIVLPAETIRSLIENHVARQETTFKPSIGKIISYRYKNLSTSDKLSFLKYRDLKIDSPHIPSVAVLDALIDDWTYRNYQTSAALNKFDSEKMESVLTTRAELVETSARFSIASNPNVMTPYKGHKPQVRSISIGYSQAVDVPSSEHLGLYYQFGNHAPWQPQAGYDRYSSIEFASAQISYGIDKKQISSWKLLFANVQSLTPLDDLNSSGSWRILAQADNLCTYCSEGSDGRLLIEGGYGPTLANQNFLFRSMPVWNLTLAEAAQLYTGPGLEFGFRWVTQSIYFDSSWTIFKFHNQEFQKIELVTAMTRNPDLNWRAKLRWDFIEEKQNTSRIELLKDF